MTHHSAGIESFINTEGFWAGVTRQLPATSPPLPASSPSPPLLQTTRGLYFSSTAQTSPLRARRFIIHLPRKWPRADLHAERGDTGLIRLQIRGGGEERFSSVTRVDWVAHQRAAGSDGCRLNSKTAVGDIFCCCCLLISQPPPTRLPSTLSRAF